MKIYTAPWSTSLILMSGFGALVCVGVAIGMIWSGRGIVSWAVLLPLAIVCGSALFTIRGYSVTPEMILIHRLFWTTRLSLSGLQSAEFEPDAMRRSIRTFGNGGLFSFCGFYRNTALGTYRAFVTDPHRTIVLHFPTRTVVVSPSEPEEFLHDIGAATPFA